MTSYGSTYSYGGFCCGILCRYSHLLPKDEEALEQYNAFAARRLDEVFRFMLFMDNFFHFSCDRALFNDDYSS